MSVECGICGGPIYFLTCPTCPEPWVVASECQQCGELRPVPCAGCSEEA